MLVNLGQILKNLGLIHTVVPLVPRKMGFRVLTSHDLQSTLALILMITQNLTPRFPRHSRFRIRREIILCLESASDQAMMQQAKWRWILGWTAFRKMRKMRNVALVRWTFPGRMIQGQSPELENHYLDCKKCKLSMVHLAKMGKHKFLLKIKKN